MLHRGLNDALPVVVIGGGPVGLAAAARLLSAGARPLVFEAGPAVGWSIRGWGQVRLFSPWKYVVDEAARALLEESGWVPPNPDGLPTGAEVVEDYLEPLARHSALAPHLRTGCRVVAVTRLGMDKVKSTGREETPFQVVVETTDGGVEHHLARAVLDASGTWTRPNPAGAGGLPAPGEAALRDRIHYGIPDVLGTDREDHAGRHTLVVGSGHSAMGVVGGLATLARRAPGTRVTWAVRRTDPGQMFGGGAADALPARGTLGARLAALVRRGEVDFRTGFQVAAFRPVDGPGGVRSLQVESLDGSRIEGVDRVVVATGFRPDLDMTRELRLELDPWLEAPVRLAPLIDPNLHSCGSVPPHGYEELQHPEPGYFVVGMKSYGRAPTFLLLTGYEQVRSVVAALTGDLEGARQVRLVLPETGVCSTGLPRPLAGAVRSAGACCG